AQRKVGAQAELMGMRTSAEALFEPMRSVGIGVEGRHLPEAGAAVQTNGLLERVIRLEPKGGQTELARLSLQSLQHAPTNAQSTDRVRDPHSLKRPHAGSDGLDRAARDRLTIDGGYQERTSWRDEMPIVGREAGAGVVS